ncbi:MAG: hypothetical protein RI571_15940, partial [Roseovarius sp.]|nr:hypothetical protein [Roseovarius sp.]
HECVHPDRQPRELRRKRIQVHPVDAPAGDLPPPAYTPQPEPGEPEDADLDNFIAPRAPEPGTPSPEAVARLQAAVGRRNGGGQAGAEEPSAEAPAAEQRSRFGINSLINRMTGHGHEAEQRPGARPARQQPPVQASAQRSASAEPVEEEDEQIEIPAFLRRQAN